MPSRAWQFVSGGVKAPVGLIVGLKEGVTIPDGWGIWSNADGKFLKGTTSDGTVGTTGTRSTPALTVGAVSGHRGDEGGMVRQNVSAYGEGESTSNPKFLTSSSWAQVGGHASHTVGITYRPASATLKLIQAAEASSIPLGSIMFGTAANADQAAFAPLNNAGILEANTATGTTTQTASGETTSSASDSHTHLTSLLTQGPTSLPPGSYTSGGSTAGGSHTHAGGTPTITPNMARATCRAFEILDATKIVGLIGMWAGSGCPTGWEVVATFDGKYLTFTSTGTGSTTGNNTLSVSGTTGGASHSHSFSGSSGATQNGGLIPHSNAYSHTHSYSGSLSYEPERYHIKFIRYVG